jgi:GMP synthase PP-ATPase subunit
VQGDYRSYSYLAVLSGPYVRDWEALKAVAVEIPNTLHQINRVALVLNRDVTLAPVIRHVTPTFLSPESLGLLRAMDHTVNEHLRAAGVLSKTNQLLTVLVPVDAHQEGRHSVAIRAVVTSDYMTARPAKLGSELPWEVMESLAETLVAQYPVDWVMYDMTSKPPATVEWE